MDFVPAYPIFDWDSGWLDLLINVNECNECQGVEKSEVFGSVHGR